MNRLLTSVVVGLAGIQGVTLAAESRPKLVVGIVVDQLRTDYLENLRDMLSKGGFKRLMENGLFLQDVDFKVSKLDATSASAIIQTGAYPRYNGVTGSYVYDPLTKTNKSVFEDKDFIGNFTTETYSPGALRVTTLTDEIAVEENGKSRIHSITPSAGQSLVLAGHAANSAFWINDETGKWASTTYYKSPPAVLQNKNYNSPLVSRLDTMKWTPLYKGEPYPYISAEEIRDSFKYTLSRSDRDVYNYYKLSPFVNQDITEAALEYITDLNLGKTDNTDVLNLGYTLAPYPQAGSTDYKYELQDAYLRLDRNLEALFNSLDRQVGKDNVLVYLVSTGYFEEPESDHSNFGLPGGTFSVKRATSLLNAFLSAKYGNGSYIDHYYDHTLYLSKKTIEERNLNLNEVSREARDFLIKMSGVEDAYVMAELMTPSLERLEAVRLATDPKSGGDILLEFNPGWTIVDDSKFPTSTENNKTSIYPTPAFIMSPGIKPQVVEQTVDAVAIAPTLAGELHIRAPNSASSKPLPY